VCLGLAAVALAAFAVTACGGKAQPPVHATYQTAPTAAVTTFAGSPGLYATVDGKAAEARFKQAWGVVCDRFGNLYVTDVTTIRKLTPAGVVTTIAGRPGQAGARDGKASAARFRDLHGITIDRSGNLLVVDANTIRKVTPNGTATTFAGRAGAPGTCTDGAGATARFLRPLGIAADARGNLYVADYQTIRKITAAGVVTTAAGQAGSGGSADGNGAAARFSRPWGVACDAAGDVYVTDQDACTVRKLTPTGVVTTVAGKPDAQGSVDASASAARFFCPRGIAVDSAGDVSVGDQDTIRLIAPTGAVTTLAGTFNTEGGANGSGQTARFNNPWGLGADASGDVCVVDYWGSTIRKVVTGQ
jgi:hypothetical protein